MVKRILAISVCLLLLTATTFAQTADDIIAKHIKARGGIERIKSVQTVRVTGTMTMGPISAPFTQIKTRLGQVRLDFTLQGMTGTQAYDGTTGWAVLPFMGKTDAETLSGNALTSLREEADLDGPLIDYKAKGNTVDYLGKENIQGAPAYKLKLTTRAGAQSTLYLDVRTDLLVKIEGRQKEQGQEIQSETTFSDYRVVDGMAYASSTQVRAIGANGSQTITIEKYEINPTLDPSLFKMPRRTATKTLTRIRY